MVFTVVFTRENRIALVIATLTVDNYSLCFNANIISLFKISCLISVELEPGTPQSGTLPLGQRANALYLVEICNCVNLIFKE